MTEPQFTGSMFRQPRTGLAKWGPIVFGALVLIVALSFPFIVDRPRFWLPNICLLYTSRCV